MKKDQKVRTVLIASGGGTDANSIMAAERAGGMPEVEIVGLVSTKIEAGCLEKAEKYGVNGIVINRKDHTERSFNDELIAYLIMNDVELIFLVGCVVKVYPIHNRPTYNMHPADPHRFGGKGMYGLTVHERVFSDVLDQVSREKKRIDDSFYTYPTVHEATIDYDSGEILLQGKVKVPTDLVRSHILGGAPSLEECAEKLQQVVLPHEWIMLPAAVRMAAKRILDERR